MKFKKQMLHTPSWRWYQNFCPRKISFYESCSKTKRSGSWKSLNGCYLNEKTENHMNDQDSKKKDNGWNKKVYKVHNLDVLSVLLSPDCLLRIIILQSPYWMLPNLLLEGTTYRELLAVSNQFIIQKPEEQLPVIQNLNYTELPLCFPLSQA